MSYIVASDHVALPLKKAVVEHLTKIGVPVHDAGPYTSETAVDYPDYASSVAHAVSMGQFDYGILICGTGLGMSIAANKHSGIRAALCHNAFTAHQARAHNDANVLCMGAWVVSPESVWLILDEWLKTTFENGRHVSRLAKLDTAIGNPIHTPVHAGPIDLTRYQLGVALTPTKTDFGPLLFQADLQAGMQAASEANLNVVELSLRNSEDLPIDTIETMMEKYDLSISAIATGQSCLYDEFCLTNLDEAKRQNAIDRLKRHVSSAARLNADVIIGGIRGCLGNSPKEQLEQRRLALEALQIVADYAASQGVSLLLEPINRYETNFVNNAYDGLAFLNEVNAENISLLLDTFDMNIEERDTLSSLRTVGNRLGYIHLADSNRMAPGQGHFEFISLLATLEEIDYRGPLVAEILPLPDDQTAMHHVGQFFQKLEDMPSN